MTGTCEMCLKEQDGIVQVDGFADIEDGFYCPHCFERLRKDLGKE